MLYKVRKKILKEDGLDAAKVKITLRDDKDASGYHDRLHGLKAFCFNLVDGKIVKTKMTDETVSKQRINDAVTTTEFAIPQVQVGSVIEYQYEINREAIFDLPTWVAQSTFPVNYTHYTIALPEYFIFTVNQTGPHRLESKRDIYNNGAIGTIDTQYEFTGTNLSALPKDNDYIYCPTDYADKVDCELQSINIPGSAHHDYTTNQSDVNKVLMTDDDFGGRLKQKNPYKDEMAAAGIANLPTMMEKADATIKLLYKHLRWNDSYGLAGVSASKVVKEGTGDNADLNFVLMAMLKDAGVEAYPAVMSRRSRGRLPYAHPSIDALNTFVIVMIDEQGVKHYFDTSAEHGYIDALPSDLNVDRAILIRNNDGSAYEEVNLQKTIKGRQTVVISGELSPEGLLAGQCKTTYADNATIEMRDDWEEKNDSAAFVADIAADNNIEITEYSTEGRDVFSNKVIETYSFTRQLDGGDKLYLNPLVFDYYGKSPFTAETSTMPIEFGVCGMMNITVQIKLPEGYHVEDAGKPFIVQLPDNALSVRMLISENSGTLTVSCRVQTNKLFYLPEEYTLVKQFYDALAAKCNEMLVISKPQQ